MKQIQAFDKFRDYMRFYATHCLNQGTNPRAIQMAMGHKSLETTMGYLHAEAMSVPSPLETGQLIPTLQPLNS